MNEYLEAFVEESKSLITDLNNLLLELEKGGDVEVMNSIFRIAHTLKGNSAAMGFESMSELAHAIEDLLDALRQGKTQLDDEIMNLIFDGVDTLENMLGEVMESGQPQSDPSELISRIRGELEKRLSGEKEEKKEEKVQRIEGEGTHVEISIDPASQMKGIDAMIILKNVEDVAEIVATSPAREEIEDGKFNSSFQLLLKGDVTKIKEVLQKLPQVKEFKVDERTETKPESEEKVEELVDKKPEEEKEKTGEAEAKETKKDIKKDIKIKTDKIQSVRISVQKLDELMNLVEELVVRKLKLENSLPPELRRGIEREFSVFDRVISRLQDTVMDLRLIPLKHVVDRLPRVVRDLSHSLGKEVDFEIIGADVTVDRTVLDKIQDPLIHLLRNAIDHGIEPPEEREKLGKPRRGKVRLVAEKMKDHVVIEISDDGRGLDAEKIKKKAVEIGLITPERAQEMSDEEAYNLIFQPGFSTKEKVTDVSGRGVGMDIVINTVRSLGGSVEVKSEKGKGTTVRLRLPLTMAIMQVLLIRVGHEKYGLPLKDIMEVKPVSRCEIRSIAGVDKLITRDGIIPVIHLAKALNVQSNGGKMVIITSSFERTVALICDEVLSQKEVVVKSLGGVLRGIQGISGVSILGEGEVVPILDVNSL
ncbi:chemotaxis protein CheA [Archaeoglobus veneficus]|uniref:Chemotaxis protein CheA n=1 Tax=Archaeoglobus veneficus (strain DSM 11195 / SNP6) TaxID=693661 RepID=F2KP62_ARCVS|nr:chemotaxis protein CheA [Archaeoglobus veneficus]AEA47466.1 CheA signal transduction histidine kinase [Archaeoglobus veneficus SNP6]